MKKLEVFDFQDSFSLLELVALCLGLDPALPVPTEGHPLCTAHAVLARAAEQAAIAGSAECARAHFDRKTRDSLSGSALYPQWALERLPDSTGFAWTPIPRERWPEQGFDPGSPWRWQFGRRCIADWLGGRTFVPEYDFSTAGGVFLPYPSDDVPAAPPEPERDVTTRERDTLLKIIYGMAKSSPYNFDPSSARSEAAPTIASAVAAAGQTIDPDTVRKYLKEAASRFGDARNR